MHRILGCHRVQGVGGLDVRRLLVGGFLMLPLVAHHPLVGVPGVDVAPRYVETQELVVGRHAEEAAEFAQVATPAGPGPGLRGHPPGHGSILPKGGPQLHGSVQLLGDLGVLVADVRAAGRRGLAAARRGAWRARPAPSFVGRGVGIHRGVPARRRRLLMRLRAHGLDGLRAHDQMLRVRLHSDVIPAAAPPEHPLVRERQPDAEVVRPDHGEPALGVQR
mmetsp:Transcript_131330/g.420203  ORF Transcript_131330/g.420203 Transcript_131330/m.420203 type:complete len:220 (-) Transcript_131330:29-688(-)